MTALDIIIVTFNSEKWIENCLKSIENVRFPLKNIYITFIDNNSIDKTRQIIQSYPNRHFFGGFQTFFLKSNRGFGYSNNFAVQRTNQQYIFFLNVDTELEPDSLSILIETAERSKADGFALWECRQFPYEHPKNYNPVTLEVSWASGAACMVDREAFLKVGMFDERIFLYAEDVDLSWRLRGHGYKLMYVPKSIVYHYSYEKAGVIKKHQFYNSTYNNLMLRYKYGTLRDIFIGYLLFCCLFFVKVPFKKNVWMIFKNLIRSFYQGLKFRNLNRNFGKLGFKPTFYIWDYEINRDGAYYVNELPSKRPLVSILIRTCGRPLVLYETLLSVRNQTYPNIEVVIVEDGPDVSRNMIEREFSDLKICYYATGEKKGRCFAGNKAMELANGKYLNFLDDDDVLYADHVEVLCSQLERNTDKKVAYSYAFETPIRVHSRDPYKYELLYHNVQHRQPFNRELLFNHNYLPIQTVMFSKDLFNEHGGFDINLEVLEDWDLWLRYAQKYDFLHVEKVTSAYRIPADSNDFHARQLMFDKYLTVVRGKYKQYNAVEASTLRSSSVIINRLRGMTARAILFKVKRKLVSRLRKWLSSR
ncbi:MAG: hypothetical protein C6W55_09090 [Thermobacillus sp.]|uniref:glycosyltransferase family 2 protein n=1 Tax=Thermobacillus sp. TaxID=2108467 RepID=UPI000E38BBC7|nr:glycosyltransferase family 2 protein [Thermobacillus sp.]REK55415.1 MAG: hypothetical protein C6W55_09090 [Thermobacillus sp.]